MIGVHTPSPTDTHGAHQAGLTTGWVSRLEHHRPPIFTHPTSPARLVTVIDGLLTLPGTIGVGPVWRHDAATAAGRRGASWRGGAEVVCMSTSTEQPDHWPIDDDVPVEELARRQGVRPVASLDELAHPELWDSEQEFEDFVADLYASRRSDIA